MPAFDDYLPEELEPRTRELATLLEYLHQQPASMTGISADEQERILTRARQRLLNPDRTTSPEASAESRPPLVLLESPVIGEEWAWQEKHNERQGRRSIQGEHTNAHSQRTSLLRIFNTIAAVLIVGALIAGSVILFTRQTSSNGGVGVSVPADPLPCFLASYADAGLTDVCQKHLYQDLNIVVKKDQYAVILTRAYADSNRVVFSLRLEELLNGQYSTTTRSVITMGDLKDEQGLVLEMIGGVGQGAETDNEFVGWSAVPSSLRTSAALHLQLNLHVMPQLRNGIVPAKDIVNMLLPFTVAMHPESRTIAINQTIVVEGVPMTIKDMHLSLSEVFFDATYNQDLTKAWPSASSLTIGKAHCGSTGDGMPTQPNIYQHIGWPQLVVPSIVIAFGCPLYQAHGQAQLVLKQNNSTKTLATFRFTVPKLA